VSSSAFLFVFIALKGVNCCASQPPAAGGARPFELFVKRERPQQVSYRILPNFVEFHVGRLDLGCRGRLLQMRHPRGAAPGVQQHRLVRIWPL
jgi:hypothetical protein